LLALSGATLLLWEIKRTICCLSDLFLPIRFPPEIDNTSKNSEALKSDGQMAQLPYL
jgi:hypothetical protein